MTSAVFSTLDSPAICTRTLWFLSIFFLDLIKLGFLLFGLSQFFLLAQDCGRALRHLRFEFTDRGAPADLTDTWFIIIHVPRRSAWLLRLDLRRFGCRLLWRVFLTESKLVIWWLLFIQGFYSLLSERDHISYLFIYCFYVVFFEVLFVVVVVWLVSLESIVITTVDTIGLSKRAFTSSNFGFPYSDSALISIQPHFTW